MRQRPLPTIEAPTADTQPPPPGCRPWRVQLADGRDRTFANRGRAELAASRLDRAGRMVLGVIYIRRVTPHQ